MQSLDKIAGFVGEQATNAANWLAGEKKPTVEPVQVEIDAAELKKYRNWIKLADKKHEDDVKKNAKKFLDRLKQIFPELTDDDNQAVFNYYKLNLSKIIPSLVPKEIKAKIKSPDGRDQIADTMGGVFDNRQANIILEGKVNTILEDKQFKYSIRALMYDLLLANLGTLVIGHDIELEQNDVVPQDTQEILNEKEVNNESVPGETVIPEKKVTGIKKMPKLTIKRESWKRIKHDPKADDFFFANGRFKVRVVLMPLADAKAKYGDIKDIDIEVDEESKNEYAKMDEAKMAVFYELYDLTGDKVRRLTFLGKGTRLLKDDTLNYDPLPSCKLNYLPDEVYPPTDMTYYESQVDESNFYRTVKMNQISRGAARKVLSKTDTIDSDNEDNLMSDKDMALVTVNTKSGQSLQENVIVVEGTRVHPDIAPSIAAINQDIQELSNVSATRYGQVPNAPATNATLANNAYESGMAEKADILKDYMVQVVERIIAELKEISVEKEDLVIKHPDGTTQTIKWGNEDIALAESIVELDITADEPTDQKLARMQNFINFVTQPAIAQQLGSDGYKVGMYEFTKEMASYFIPNSNFDRFVFKSDQLPNPDKENIMMMAGQQVQPQPTEDFKAHMAAHNGFLQIIGQTMPQLVPVLQAHIAQTQQVMNEQEALKQAPVPAPQKEGPVAAQTRQAAPQSLLGAAQNGK